MIILHPYKKGYLSAIKDLLEKDIGRSLREKEENKISKKYSEYNDSEEFRDWLEEYKSDLYKNNVRIYSSKLFDRIFDENDMRVRDEAKEEMIQILTSRTLDIIEDLSDVMVENSRRILTKEDVEIMIEKNNSDMPWYRHETISNMEFEENLDQETKNNVKKDETEEKN